MAARSSRPRSSATAQAFARLVEAAHAGVYIGTLTAEGSRTLAANPHLKLIFGYPLEATVDEVRPFDPARFVDPEAREAFLARLARDQAVTDYLLRLRRTDARPIWVELTARAEPVAGEHAVRVEALVRDVSERRARDDETRELYQRLLQAEKLAALGQTISGVAHELNNPLATILMWAERLAQRPLDETVRRGLSTIQSEAERAARIVRNLLTFARKRQSTRTLVDLNQIVRETLALRAYEQRVANITAVEALASGLPPVFADPHQLKQVLLNLVINAEQAMVAAHGRGTLVVRTWHDPDRGTVRLEVTDDGPGVPEELQSKIFDPFFTTKEAGAGTGLGLTVAHAILEEHGGRISLRSMPGQGASFLVELPGLDRPVAPVPRAPAPPARAFGDGAAALIVEDEPDLAAAVAEALREAGFDVETAADGKEALARIRSRAYKLVVCDLKMPRLDGPAFYRAIARLAPATARRVIFVTGDVIGADTARFLDESGCPWLAKPFRLAELLRVAREIVGAAPAAQD